MILLEIRKHENEEKKLTAELRKANILCKINQSKKLQKERAELLAGGEEVLRRRREKAQLDSLQSSREITQSLRRSIQLVTDELERKATTMDVLEGSSGVLWQTVDVHSALSSHLKQGHGLLTKIKQRDLTDKLLILFGLAFFILVVLYIVKRRTIG